MAKLGFEHRLSVFRVLSLMHSVNTSGIWTGPRLLTGPSVWRPEEGSAGAERRAPAADLQGRNTSSHPQSKDHGAKPNRRAGGRAVSLVSYHHPGKTLAWLPAHEFRGFTAEEGDVLVASWRLCRAAVTRRSVAAELCAALCYPVTEKTVHPVFSELETDLS